MIKKLCAVNIKSNSLLSCLSVSTMCLLIFASIIIITVISITPIIILGLGQISAGQRDVVLTPIQNYLNCTKVAELTSLPAMPRLRVPITANSQNALGWFIDFQLEEEQHLGQLSLKQQKDNGIHYIYAASRFGFKQGSKVKVKLNDLGYIRALRLKMMEDGSEQSEKIVEQLDYVIGASKSFEATFTVGGVFEESLGKFPVGTVNNYIYFNIRNAFQYIVQQTYNQLQRTQPSAIAFTNYINSKSFNLADYSSQITINIPNRIDVYKNSDYQETYNTLSSFGTKILEDLGIFSVHSEIPIAENLVEMSYFGMFIGVILKLIILSLFILSVLMMNNMLLMGIDRKSFDFALLKTMGANRIFIVLSLLSSSMRYVFAANFFAFPFAYVVLGGVSAIFDTFFGYSYQVEPTFASILGGLFIGILVPVVSSIAPIWGIIKDDLAQNLNPIRNKTESIKTQIYVEGRQFPYGKLTFGIIAFTFGLMIYYLLPKGMINEDISLLLFVFFAILVGLLLGLILLSYSFQYLFEKLVAYITLFWVNKTDFKLTMKNMSAHRFKNRRSSLLYALSVAFIIFVSVGISIQIQTIQESLLNKHGTYIEINSFAQIYRQYYDGLLGSPQFKDQIIDWAYQTIPLYDEMMMNQNVKQILFSDLAKIYFKWMSVYGVSPNFLKVLPSQQISIVKSYAYEPYDPYEFLYTPEGYMTCTLSQFAAEKFNLLDTDNRELLLSIYKLDKAERIKMNISTVFEKRAGLGYSQFQFGHSDVGVSLQTFAELAGLKSINDIPYQSIKVQVRDPSNTRQLANRLRKQMSRHNIDSVWDFSQVSSTINKIKNLLTQILDVLLVLVLIISFFSLVTTSYVNIVNQSTEIAILMTLGYDKSRIVRIFIYEAFVLVVNSCLIGVAVGWFVAWMMGLQRELFGDFPVQVEINGIWIIAIAAVLSSILSTIKPIREIFSKSINQIFMYS